MFCHTVEFRSHKPGCSDLSTHRVSDKKRDKILEKESDTYHQSSDQRQND